MEWTLIRVKLIMEIFKKLEKTGKDELESFLVKLKNKFK